MFLPQDYGFHVDVSPLQSYSQPFDCVHWQVKSADASCDCSMFNALVESTRLPSFLAAVAKGIGKTLQYRDKEV